VTLSDEDGVIRVTQGNHDQEQQHQQQADHIVSSA